MRFSTNWSRWALGLASVLIGTCGTTALAGEADINLPDLQVITFNILGTPINGLTLLYGGLVVCVIGLIFGLVQYFQTKAMPVHECMSSVSQTIWETCKTYLFQQGKLLAILWVLVGACMLYYFGALQKKPAMDILLILACSVLGILGSYGVAWFGIRINTRANSRSAFAALRGTPWQALAIPMKSGMSVGLLLVSVELFFMICILVFLPKHLRRHLHQDRRNRVRPDEDRLQAPGR